MATTENQPVIEQTDLSDADYAVLAAAAQRIGALLTLQKVQADADMSACLDEFLGAIYALVFAKQRHFADRVGRPVDPRAYSSRAEQLARGEVRIDGKWMAGFFFNSAILRIAAVYHRSLKVVTGQPATKKYVKDMLGDADTSYKRWTNSTSPWSRQSLQSVHDEVNDLKHTAKGLHDTRHVTFKEALGAVGELLALIEAWAK